MITDAVIGMVHALFAGFVGLLPPMSGVSDVAGSFGMSVSGAFQALWLIAGHLNVVLPIEEVWDFMPVMLGLLGVMALWRLARLFLPGGGG